MLSLDEAREHIFRAAGGFVSSKEHACSLDQALGRVLARPLVATINVPPASNSAMDGYAVDSLACQCGDAFPVSQTVYAGQPAAPLVAGTVARVFTGAEIPPGADAVIIQEDTETSNSHVRLRADVSAGDNIRPAGQDVAVGEQILSAGHRMRPEDLALAASINTTEVWVRPALKVALLVTGSELVEPGRPLLPGQIYNSNRPMLEALLVKLGCEVICQSVIADDFSATCEALSSVASKADIIVTTGGVSVGDADYVKDAVQALGKLKFWKVAMKPGKPVALGEIEGTPVLGLPGNPVSAYVSFQLLLRPFLQVLAGEQVTPLMRIDVPAAFARNHPGRRDEYARGRITDQGAVLYSQQSSGALSSVVWADCLVYLPANEKVIAGRKVQVLPLAQWR